MSHSIKHFAIILLAFFIVAGSVNSQVINAPKKKNNSSAPTTTKKAPSYTLAVDGHDSDFEIPVFPAEGGAKEMNVITNAPSYTVEETPSWCTLLSQMGATFSLRCAPNDGIEKRTGSVTVALPSGKKMIISVSQNGIGPKLSVNTYSDSYFQAVPSTESTQGFAVVSLPAEYTVSDLPYWCTLESKNSSSFTVRFTKNLTSSRSGSFKVSNRFKTVTVNVSQEAYVDPFKVENAFSRDGWRSKVQSHKYAAGAISYSGGDRFVGMKENGNCRFGAYFWTDGSIYFGTFDNGKRDGFGIYIVDDPSKYEVLNCKGAAVFVGEYSRGLKSGNGECYDRWGNALYRGSFSNDKPSGYYSSTPSTTLQSDKFQYLEYTNGNYYLGETENGLRAGIGIFFWSGGAWWLGFWKNGERAGLGIYVDANGNWDVGEWKGDTKVSTPANNNNNNANQAAYQMGYELGRSLFQLFSK